MAEGVTLSHIVSSTALETHVFLSLVHKTPLYVLTPGKEIWKVTDGDISKIGTQDWVPSNPDGLTCQRRSGL